MASKDRLAHNIGRPSIDHSTTIEKLEPSLKPPSMYQVLLLNDDFTPMEFVVLVLQAYFHKNRERATQIMLRVHQEGYGVCGVYTRDVAATKIDLVLCRARQDGYPLQCVMEEI